MSWLAAAALPVLDRLLDRLLDAGRPACKHDKSRQKKTRPPSTDPAQIRLFFSPARFRYVPLDIPSPFPLPPISSGDLAGAKYLSSRHCFVNPFYCRDSRLSPVFRSCRLNYIAAPVFLAIFNLKLFLFWPRHVVSLHLPSVCPLQLAAGERPECEACLYTRSWLACRYCMNETLHFFSENY